MNTLKLLQLFILLCVEHLIRIFFAHSEIVSNVKKGNFRHCFQSTVSWGKTGYPTWDKNICCKTIIEVHVNNVSRNGCENYTDENDNDFYK